MTNPPITYVALAQSISYSDYVEAFEFRRDRSYPWLQRICFFILRKLKAFKQEQKVTITTLKIDTKSFMRQLYAEMSNFKSFFNAEPTVLLIGRDDYMQMMLEWVPHQHFFFSAVYYKETGPFGLTVHVIPWMQGHLILPRDLYEEKKESANALKLNFRVSN